MERERIEIGKYDGDVVVDPAKTALIVIDLQNGFCHPDAILLTFA